MGQGEKKTRKKYNKTRSEIKAYNFLLENRF